ncbi:MAG: hypothetical protein KIS92_14265 [Planctomycetota bacterium]|nr:hypothetical protein [Planctomycetota bacterium]
MSKFFAIPKTITAQVATLARKASTGLMAPRKLEEFVVAVDVGSSRIACALAEIQDDHATVLAADAVPSYGIRNGEIVDLERAGESIRIAVQAVGDKVDAEIRSVVVGFSGDVRLNVSKSTIELGGEQPVVAVSDVARLRKSLWPDLGGTRRVVHRFDGPFAVGEVHGVERPVGLRGATLGMSAGFLTAPNDRIDNLLKTVRSAGIEVEDLALEPLASSMGSLTPDERILGVAVLDFGAGGFRGTLWEGGRMRQTCAFGQERHTPALGVSPASSGMEGVVLGLARHFRIAPGTARRLLKEHAAVGDDVASGPALDVPAVDGLTSIRVEMRDFNKTLEDLLTPAIRSLRDGLPAYTGSHAGGLVIVGMGGKLKGLPSLVARHFGGAPVRPGTPHWEVAREAALPEELSGPGGCTLSGLVHFGAESRARLRLERAASLWGRMRMTVRRVAAAL